MQKDAIKQLLMENIAQDASIHLPYYNEFQQQEHYLKKLKTIIHSTQALIELENLTQADLDNCRPPNGCKIADLVFLAVECKSTMKTALDSPSNFYLEPPCG